MRRSICVLLICSLLLSITPAHAADVSAGVGTFRVTTTVLHRGGGQVGAEKVFQFLGSNGEIIWKVTLSSIFSFNGYSATCTSASAVSTVYSGNWSESANNTYPSGNQAIANVTMVRKILFIVVQTEIANLVITCDKDGNIT